MLALLLGCAATLPVSAQWNRALEAYAAGGYREALGLFRQVQGPEARLFEAKSLVALDQPDEALRVLRNMPAADPALRAEWTYTRALAEYATTNTAEALRLLHEVKDRIPEARELYAEIVAWLSPREREEALRAIDIPAVRNDLLASEPAAGSYPPAPHGTVIAMGVAFPIVNRDLPEYAVVQALFNGVALAAADFNNRNPNIHLSVHAVDIRTDGANRLEQAIRDRDLKLVVGPLRSDDAEALIPVVVRNGVPLLVPLANHPRLPRTTPEVLLFNPDIEDAGIAMARFVLDSLRLQRVMVLAQAESDGHLEATAFTETLRASGLTVDLRVGDFGMNDGTMQLAVGDALTGPDSLRMQAIYAPFTGQQARAQLDRLVTFVEARRTEVVLLGNDELGYLDHPADRLARNPVYHTSLTDLAPKTELLEAFRSSYLDLTGIEPTDFAYIGYDVADFALRRLQQVQHPDLLRTMLTAPGSHSGLQLPIRFGTSRQNRRIPVYELQPDGPVLKN